MTVNWRRLWRMHGSPVEWLSRCMYCIFLLLLDVSLTCHVLLLRRGTSRKCRGKNLAVGCDVRVTVWDQASVERGTLNAEVVAGGGGQVATIPRSESFVAR